jgi:rhodanese-related sulfurtransferase
MKKIFVTLFLPLFFLLACAQIKVNTQKAKEFMVRMQSASQKTILDLRTPEEFKAAHVTEAININFNDANFQDKISNLNKNKPIFVYGAESAKSLQTSNMLAQLGFKSIFNLEGTYLDLIAAGLK